MFLKHVERGVVEGPPSSRSLQRSASQHSQSQNSHPSHIPSQPSHPSSRPSARNSRSISGSGPKGSQSRSRDSDVPPIELIPPYHTMVQRADGSKTAVRGDPSKASARGDASKKAVRGDASKTSARMQQKAFEHIAALSNV